jgi:hypothetical protein
LAGNERVRIEVAFEGGHVVSALVDEAVAERLADAIDRGDESGFQIEADDGRYTLNLNRVVYVKRHAREPRVGFGA